MRKITDLLPWEYPADHAEGPQYLALRDQIALNIELGKLLPGTRLPSERQIQAQAGIARGTIRQALSQLEAEGLIYRRDRSGWYVSPPAITYDPTRWAGFMAYVTEQGRVPKTMTIGTTAIPATALLADIFRVAPGTQLYRIDRKRTIDDRAVLAEQIIVDPGLAPKLIDQSLNGSLTQILKAQYGITVSRNRVDMRPCALTKDAAEALGTKPGTPSLMVVRTSFDEKGRVVEYDQEYWRHDAIRVHVDLSVRGEVDDQ